MINLPDAETVFTLNHRRAGEIRRPQLSPEEFRAKVREMAGFEPARGPVPVTPYGVLTRDGYRIEKMVYESEPGIRVPALLFVPQSGAARKPASVAFS